MSYALAMGLHFKLLLGFISKFCGSLAQANTVFTCCLDWISWKTPNSVTGANICGFQPPQLSTCTSGNVETPNLTWGADMCSCQVPLQQNMQNETFTLNSASTTLMRYAGTDHFNGSFKLPEIV
jgi:hypothetical protein